MERVDFILSVIELKKNLLKEKESGGLRTFIQEI